MPEVLSDEQILGISDDAPEVSSDTSEPSAPVETEPEITATETPLRPDSAKDGSLPVQTKPQADKTQQSDKSQPPTKPTDPAQDAAEYRQIFPRGIEQAREFHAKATELDRADASFRNGDYSGMGQTIEAVFGDNPHGLADSMWMGMKFLEERAPAELAGFSRIVVSDELEKAGLTNFIENALKNPSQAHGALQKIAGFLGQRYGLGPSSPETQASSWQGYVKATGDLMVQTINSDVSRALGAELSGVPPLVKQDLLAEARVLMKEALSKDRDVASGFQKLSISYNRNAGVKFFLDKLDPKIRSLIPRVVQSLKAQYGQVFSKPAPSAPRSPAAPAQAQPERAQSPLGLEESRKMTIADVLNSTRPIDHAAPARPRSAKLTREEARNMSFSQIINDDREVASP